MFELKFAKMPEEPLHHKVSKKMKMHGMSSGSSNESGSDSEGSSSGESDSESERANQLSYLQKQVSQQLPPDQSVAIAQLTGDDSPQAAGSTDKAFKEEEAAAATEHHSGC